MYNSVYKIKHCVTQNYEIWVQLQVTIIQASNNIILSWVLKLHFILMLLLHKLNYASGQQR